MALGRIPTIVTLASKSLQVYLQASSELVFDNGKESCVTFLEIMMIIVLCTVDYL